MCSLPPRCLHVLAATVLLAYAAHAQDRTGRITGTVHDPAGAPITGAQITARNVQTGIKSEAKTSDGGDYTLPLLDPGTYEIDVAQQGFKSVQQSGIVVHVNDQVKLDYSLELGQVNEVVNVHEDLPLLRTADASLGQVVDNQKVTSLPLNGRSSFRLVNLTPGFIGTSGANGQFGDIPVNSTWDSNFSINGGQGYSNEIMIERHTEHDGLFQPDHHHAQRGRPR